MTLQDKFQKHLSWFYGNKAKLKASIEDSLGKYNALEHKSPFVQARIKQYEWMAAMCEEAASGTQLTIF